MEAAEKKHQCYCSFCGRSNTEAVERMIAASPVYICNFCVAVCVEVIAVERKKDLESKP